MRITCPKCGQKLEVVGLGRKPLNVSLNNVLKAICATSSGLAAARLCGCSESYVFMILRRQNLKIADVRSGQIAGPARAGRKN